MVHRPWLQTKPASSTAEDTVSPLPPTADACPCHAISRIHNTSRVSMSQVLHSASTSIRTILLPPANEVAGWQCLYTCLSHSVRGGGGRDNHWSGRHASHWNAFLTNLVFKRIYGNVFDFICLGMWGTFVGLRILFMHLRHHKNQITQNMVVRQFVQFMLSHKISIVLSILNGQTPSGNFVPLSSKTIFVT